MNEKYYIGMHSTDNLNDGYIGSGKRLWYSINKYGKENFKCEILEYLPDRESLKEKEEEIVNENLLKDPKCLNLKTGGYGGGGLWSEEHKIKFNKAGLKKIEFLKKNDKEYQKRIHIIFSERNRKLWGNGTFKHKPPSFKDYKHSKEVKEKIGLTNSLKQSGDKNSQFGTCWITNGIENKKIKKETEIPQGWYKGRK